MTTIPSTTNPTTSIPHGPSSAAQLYRVRTGVRAVLALGVAASVAANVLHAQPTIVGRSIAAWSPLALLLTVELISRVPVYRRWLAAVRITATAAIASIAAWVSYWHMVQVAVRAGEQPTSAHLLPLSVDGLIVVASVCLVEISARLHATQQTAQLAAELARELAGEQAPQVSPVQATEAAPESPELPATPVPSVRPASKRPATKATRTAGQSGKGRAQGRRPGRPAGQSAAATVRRLAEQHPEWNTQQIATKAGVSERTVRRHLNAPTPEQPAQVEPVEVAEQVEQPRPVRAA